VKADGKKSVENTTGKYRGRVGAKYEIGGLCKVLHASMAGMYLAGTKLESHRDCESIAKLGKGDSYTWACACSGAVAIWAESEHITSRCHFASKRETRRAHCIVLAFVKFITTARGNGPAMGAAHILHGFQTVAILFSLKGCSLTKQVIPDFDVRSPLLTPVYLILSP
jgi:hypothetical protein